MGDADFYSLDAAELDDVIGDLERLERELEATTNDLERQIATLHDTWEGQTAVAQREAHQEWEQGMRAMRDSLAQMRSAARNAHQNYARAAEANQAMWSGLG
jgi:WXG100 family type VII secretion target